LFPPIDQSVFVRLYELRVQETFAQTSLSSGETPKTKRQRVSSRPFALRRSSQTTGQ